MQKKLIVKVLFEKKKIAVLFFLLCVFLIVYSSVQTVFATYGRESANTTPDIVFHGTVYQSQDGSYPFIGYNDIGSFTAKAQEIGVGATKCYGITYRSLYNYYDELTSVGFFGALYGMPDACIEENITAFIETGRPPEPNKEEALIGYYFAMRFGLKIGDPIPQAITLNKTFSEEDIDNYTVCGILKENVSEYFNGSAIISRETFESANGPTEDNMMLGYYTNAEQYDTIFLEMNAERLNYRVPEGSLNVRQKEFARIKIYINAALVILMSVFMLTALVSYLMKGITPKLGLMKAIGISTKYLIKTFLSGMFCIFTAALTTGILLSSLILYLMNRYVSDFYKFDVHTYQLSSMSLLLDGFEFLFIILYVFAIIYYNCKKVSPKVAMAKTA